MNEEKNKKLIANSLNRKFEIKDLAPEPPESCVVLFNNSLDGFSCFVTDDSCYVLKNWVGGEWKTSKWLYGEAIEELKKLPSNPRDTYRVEHRLTPK